MTITVLCNFRQKDDHTSLQPIDVLRYSPKYPNKSNKLIHRHRHLSSALVIFRCSLFSHTIWVKSQWNCWELVGNEKNATNYVKPFPFLSIWCQNALVWIYFSCWLLQRIHVLWSIMWFCVRWIWNIWIFYLHNNDFVVIFDAANFHIALTIVHIFILNFIHSLFVSTCNTSNLPSTKKT